MTPERLEFLKNLVITEYQSSETSCFFVEDRDDLLALLDAEIARQSKPLTKFEAWKQGLTLDDAIAMAERMDTCAACPARNYEMPGWAGECEDCFRAWAEDSTDCSTANTGATDDSTGAKVMTGERAIIEACYKKLEVAIGYAESIEDSPDYRTALEMLKDAAISALRQKQEPCEWCNAEYTIIDDDFGQPVNPSAIRFCWRCGLDLSRKDGE